METADIVRRITTKTKDSQFMQMLKKEFEFPPRTARAVLEAAREMYNLDKIEPELLGEKGKIVRIVMSDNAKHGPVLDELPMIEVTLTLNNGSDDTEIRRLQGANALRQKQILRMTEECAEQGGLLSQEDLGDILSVSSRTIRRDIKELKKAGVPVSTRGVVKDIGPAISHKTKIIKLYLEGKTYSEISRWARHSITAIDRYIKSFKKTVFLKNKGMTNANISYSIGISNKVVSEYVKLYLEYNTPANQERLMDICEINKNDRDDGRRKKGASK